MEGDLMHATVRRRKETHVPQEYESDMSMNASSGVSASASESAGGSGNPATFSLGDSSSGTLPSSHGDTQGRSSRSTQGNAAKRPAAKRVMKSRSTSRTPSESLTSRSVARGDSRYYAGAGVAGPSSSDVALELLTTTTSSSSAVVAARSAFYDDSRTALTPAASSTSTASATTTSAPPSTPDYESMRTMTATTSSASSASSAWTPSRSSVAATSEEMSEERGGWRRSLVGKKALKSATPALEPAPTWFHDLPIDLLANIFSHFSEKEVALQLSLVCRRWRAAAKHPRLWRRLEFAGSRVATSVVCRLLRTAPLLLALRLDAVPNASTIVRQLCRCNPEVQFVTIRNCTFGKEELIPETVFRNLIVCCPKIVALDLKGTQFSAFRFYQEIIHLSQLKSLNVGGNRFLKVQDLMTLALNCKGLQELKVAKRPPREGFGKLSDSDAVYMFTHLKAALVSLKMDVAGLGDAALLSILKCTQLRKLGLLNARDFSGERMRLLEENLQKLVSLKLTYPCQMKQSHFRYLFSGQTSNLHNLVKLSLIACWGLEDAGLQAVVETCKGSLQSLSLKCCKTLSGAALRGVVRQCSLLRRLNVAYASQVSPSRSAAAAAAFSYLDDVPYHLPKLAKLVVDLAYRKGHCLANLHGRMPDLAIAVSHSEFSNDEILLAF